MRTVVAFALVIALFWVFTLWSTVEDVFSSEVRVSATSVAPASSVPGVAPSAIARAETMARQPETLPRVGETGPTKRLTIRSSAYCETGKMADGNFAHEGAVSSHVLARGSRWMVRSGRFAGREVTVEDTGPLATFDLSLPGRCADAIDYGSPTIEIEAVA